MPTFYCIWPCDKCDYCNTLGVRKCRNCGEPLKGAEQPMYLEDKNMLEAHNQRILTSCPKAAKGLLCFTTTRTPCTVNQLMGGEGDCAKSTKQLFDYEDSISSLDTGSKIQFSEEIVKASLELSKSLDSVYEANQDVKGNSTFSDLEQGKCLEVGLAMEISQEMNLSLDTEFDMYRKLHVMSLKQAVGNGCFQECKGERLQQYFPKCNVSESLDGLDQETLPDYCSMDSTENYIRFDDDNNLRHEQICTEMQNPTPFSDFQNPANLNCYSDYPIRVEEIDEASFFSAVTSAQKSFVNEDSAFSIPAERSSVEPFVACKSSGSPEVDVENNVIDHCRTDLDKSIDIQTELLLPDCTTPSQHYIPCQIEEFANDHFDGATPTNAELNVRADIFVPSTFSKAENCIQSENDSKQSNSWAQYSILSTYGTIDDSCESAVLDTEVSRDADQLKLFEDSFVSAAGDSIVFGSELNCDATSHMNDLCIPLTMTGGNNKSVNCEYQTSEFITGDGTLTEEISVGTKVKHAYCSSTDIIKIDQGIDACTDFRVNFTIDKATMAKSSVINKAENTDITLMSKNRPTLGQSGTCRSVACNTKWSTIAFSAKAQNTQTTEIGTEEKCTNTILQTTDLNSYLKELDANRYKTKLKKALDELAELKKKYKSIELQEQHPLSGTKDVSHPSSCCSKMKQRAIKAELQLLNMQYWMCQQHCWKIHSLTIEESAFSDLGSSLLDIPTEYSSAVSSVLQELKVNYESMKERVQHGISLDNLPLLSVEIKGPSRITNFVPATLGNPKLMSEHQKHLKNGTETAAVNVPLQGLSSGRAVGDTQDQSDHWQHATDRRVQIQTDCVNTKNLVKDPEVTDDWFDAQENVTASGSSSSVQGDSKSSRGLLTGAEDTEKNTEAGKIRDLSFCIGKSMTKESVQTRYIYVDRLSKSMTGMEIRNLFQKYQVSGVWLGSLRSEDRCGVLRVASASLATLAVDEMNGRELHGKIINVHLAKVSGGHMLPVFTYSQPPAFHTVQTPDGKMLSSEVEVQQSSVVASSAPTKVPNTASHKQVNRRKYRQMQALQGTPTTTGIFIPQNSANLSSFNKLMKTLVEMHPDTNRDAIIEALKEVKANNKGFLNGLALNTIVQMTSAILKSRPSVNG
ncbi:RNA-binding protein 44 [Callorhinchus milii]|uniref:RNA-binding protein 44 n=1 Tax=Callorhinchus milii TaxID=7868 RepID=UPI001C3F6D88|nr:RNA-binding protein 44 [Callorhinchus milii]